MRISPRSLFDLPDAADLSFLPEGVSPGPGWDPLVSGCSIGPDCSLIFSKAAYPQPIPLVIDLVAFDTPVLLTVHCPGAPAVRTVLDQLGIQSVLIQSPIQTKGSDQAELQLRLSAWPESLGARLLRASPFARPARLSGLRVLRIAPPLSFPLALNDPATQEACLGSGWSHPEPTGIWSDGALARLRLPSELWRPRGTLAFDLSVLPRGAEHPPLRLRIRNGETLLAETSFPLAKQGPVICPVKDHWHMGRPLELALELDNPLSPAMLGINEDHRHLGVFLRHIEIFD